MQILAPITQAWSRRLTGRPLRERMRLLPIGMAVAFAAIFAVSVTLGVLDPRSLTKVQRDYYPALRASRDMRETLSDLQNALQNAVATRDTERFAESDSLRDAFVAAASEARVHSDDRAALEALSQRFESYYATARPLSKQLIDGTGGEAVNVSVNRMTTGFR
jgi:hypothetical protein